MKIGNRIIDENNKPFIIVEIGINHNGDMNKAKKMIKDAYYAGAECVKFQRHVIEDEMIPNNVIPGNAKESIWDIMKRCSLTLEQHKYLKKYVESLGMIYLCTPFSRKAADELESIGVIAYKIGSGECNNYPLIEHIASFNKPIILSTGMNNINTIYPAVNILIKNKIEFALLHCTSMYPTPYNKVRLNAINELKSLSKIVGLSDHSIGNYTSFAAISFGAKIIEKHFTSNKSWQGEDISISIDKNELKDLIIGCNAIHESLYGNKEILQEEQVTIDFAYSSVVAIKDIKKGEQFTKENIWVKRPGTGEIPASKYDLVLYLKSKRDIKKDEQIKLNDLY